MEQEAWSATRAALADASHRCAELLKTVDDPDARAVGDWSVGDVAAHLIEVSVLNTLLATNAPPPPEWAEVYGKAVTASMDQVKDMNASPSRSCANAHRRCSRSDWKSRCVNCWTGRQRRTEANRSSGSAAPRSRFVPCSVTPCRRCSCTGTTWRGAQVGRSRSSRRRPASSFGCS